MRPYSHTQIGWVTIIGLGAALLICLIVADQLSWPVLFIPIYSIVALALVLFATLTVTVDDRFIRLRFGPGPIRKRFPLAEIANVGVVRNTFLHGWGIHWTPQGWVYNVSGYGAVEIRMRNGRRCRIGSDEPEILCEAIRERLDVPTSDG